MARSQSEISRLRAQLRQQDDELRKMENECSQMDAEMASMRAVIDRQVHDVNSGDIGMKRRGRGGKFG